MALCPVPPRRGVRHSARRLGCGSLTPDMLGIPRVSLPFGLCGLVLAGCSITGSVKPPPAVEAPTRHVLHNGVRVLDRGTRLDAAGDRTAGEDQTAQPEKHRN